MFASTLLDISSVSVSMSRPTGEDETVDPDVVARRLRERAASTKRRQVALATEKLDGHHRDELAELGEHLVDRLLAGPLGTLSLAAERNDPELARTVATLFDVDSRSDRSDDANDDTRETPPLEQ